MRVIKFVFLVFLISSLSISASALNLDVDNDLANFADENLLNNTDSNSLINPFLIEIPETKKQEENLDQVRDDFIEENTNLPEPELEVVEPKKEELLTINGVISASSNKTALLINYQNTNHVLRIGNSIDDYRLVSYQNGEATFIRNGNSIIISY
jgi:hypothetical protein